MSIKGSLKEYSFLDVLSIKPSPAAVKPASFPFKSDSPSANKAEVVLRKQITRGSEPMKLLITGLCVVFLSLGISQSIRAQGAVARASALKTERSDREQDGLTGPVRRLRVETAKLCSRAVRPLSQHPRYAS